MPDIKKRIKFITEQKINTNKAPVDNELPLRNWSVEVVMVNDQGADVPATIFDKVMYELHPSFGKRAKQVKKDHPFRIQEEGWGEFEMYIHLTPVGKGPEQSIGHDLNFGTERYEVTHDLTFRNPKPEFLKALEEAGMGGAGENGVRKGVDTTKKRGKKDKNVDMEKLADGLQRLTEDDLLHVVQMIHDQKSADTYTKNDVDNGEFHVDLYTLPDTLVKSLWDYTAQKVDV